MSGGAVERAGVAAAAAAAASAKKNILVVGWGVSAVSGNDHFDRVSGV